MNRPGPFQALWMIAVLLLITTQASALGIIVPREPGTPPPVLESVDVSAKVTNNFATTRITKVYKNTTGRPVEADFIFPVPDGADITDFVLYMDGKPVKGEVLDKDEAATIYRDIVRKLKDPGLIEWSDKNLFRVRIFPIPANGTQKLEIELSQALTADQGYFRYFLPMESGRHPTTSSASPSMKIGVVLESESPLRNVYSPTHKIETSTSTSTTMEVKASELLSMERRDFILYYGTSDDDIAVSLLTHKAEDKDGYFTLRISPPWDAETTRPRQGADYVFVIDTSGSMLEGGKIDQARKALKYCVNLLDDSDKFGIIEFATTVNSHEEELMTGSDANREAARQWIDKLQARGGTNISEALRTALDYRTASDSERLFTLVFLTDGLPTVGETSPDAILETVSKESGGNVRIFTFGIGNDVNTRLLDFLADETRAASDYVAPETDLEVPVSRFFDKVSRPALYNVKLKIPNAGVSEIYPGTLPDLFYGTELAVFGKYSKAEPSKITLTGTLDGEEKVFLFEKTFPAEATDNGFVEKLWATRKVAWMLDQVRKSGENEELTKEIKELARKYGIVTPYTSYLAMEDTEVAAAVPQASAAPTRTRHTASASPVMRGEAADAYMGVSKANQAMELHFESGERAVRAARNLGQMKAADSLPAASSPLASHSPTTMIVDGRTFVMTDGIWKEESITGSEDNVIKIAYMSDAWFQLSQDFPEIREVLALGEKIQLRLDDKTALHIDGQGIDSIDVKTKETLKRLLSGKN